MSRESYKSGIPVDFDPFAEPAKAAVPFPLTEAQREVWASSQISTEASCAYNVCHAFRVRGPFSIDSMKAAFQQLMDRHQALRLVCDADGETQHELPSPRMPVIAADLSPLSADQRESAALEYIDRETTAPFDLESGPLCRAVIVREARDLHLILFTAHHIICDGWSGGILIQELGDLYEAESVGMAASLPPATPFQAYVAEQQASPLVRESEHYWANQFATPVPPLELALDVPRSAVKSYASDRQRRQIPGELFRDLSRVASKNGCTIYTILFAAMEVLIYRLSGQDQFVLGAVVATQAGSKDGATLVGHATHVLPIRATIDAGATFPRHLKNVRTALLDAFDHQALTLGSVIRQLRLPRDPSRNPLVTATFNFDQTLSPFRFRGVEGELLPPPKRFATFDVEFNLVQSATDVFVECIHDAAITLPSTATRWLEHYINLLSSISRDPGKNLADLVLLTGDEERQLVLPPAKTSHVEVCLHERFEQQARRTPDAIALVCESASLTYAELNRRANAVAQRLAALGAGPEVLVGLCVERNLDLVVGILGILKAGAAYLPIDLSYPPERILFMLEDAKAHLIVSQRSLSAQLPPQATALFLDEVTERGEDRFSSAARPENLAYVIYTSGSSGKPKGCQITHANAVRLFDQTEAWYGFGPSDVWTLFHSSAFDFSVWEIWGALLYGGRLVVVPYWVSRSPDAFAHLLAKERVTVLNQTPSAFRQLAPFVIANTSPAEQSLRYVIFGGEALDLASLLPWMEHFGDSRPRLVNMYGITETTVHVTYRPLTMDDVRQGAGSVIGQPIPDLAVYLLDPHGHPVPVGVAAEMYVAGAGVARGYLRRPELTAERFVENPFGAGRLYRTGDLAKRLPNGDLEYLGRIDDQVKIRGFRIELAEIEHALQATAGVREAAVAIHKDREGDYLVGYAVPETGVHLTIVQLRESLSKTLPNYMLPSAFVLLERLPVTGNGKVDRKSLPEPEAGMLRKSQDFVPPETPTQLRLAGIWEDLLKVEKPGIHENFFDLGGHSILAARLMAQVRSTFGIQMTLQHLFQTPTIAGLAESVEQCVWTETRRSAPAPAGKGVEFEI